ncbi:MAG: hydro-lyase, Fe-S type, tartrate/fumarate subfamily, beta subunit [Anaerospora sp.]|nr:hydro-lyase, Fe-S type, tartrate/fumarate subfamily, beta subunit [Anaerospora sp.]
MKKVLTTPIKNEDLENITVGDVVYLDGYLITCRDVAHRRLIELGEKFEKEFIKQTGVKLIIGKGGMGPETVEGCKNDKALHAVFPGGCAVLAATEVEEIERVEWQDLGMPESLWVSRVKNFGPLIISIDTKGNNLFEKNKAVFNEKKTAIVEDICKQVKFIK